MVPVTEVNEEADDDEQRFNQMTFVVATRKLEQLPQWVKVSEVFKSDSDAPFLKAAGVAGFDDPRYEKYSLPQGASGPALEPKFV